jgi:hypothetical protein
VLGTASATATAIGNSPRLVALARSTLASLSKCIKARRESQAFTCTRSAPMGRTTSAHEVMVRLNDAELARLDEIRPGGVARAVYLRNLLREPPTDQDVADREEALAILSELARAGRVAAAVALVRELRPDDGKSIESELDRLLG